MLARRRISRWMPALTAVALLATGCSHAGSTPSAAATIERARAGVDAATSVHFVLTSMNVPSGGTRLIGGHGFAARPAAFQGVLSVRIGPGTVSLDLISVGGTVYAKLPFTSGYQTLDPSRFGITDPGLLLNPTTGLSRLLRSVTEPTSAGDVRLGGDVTTKITGRLPGTVLAGVLGDADPSVPVRVVVYVVKANGQLRRAELTGPVFARGTTSTLDLVLDQYNGAVSIHAPATG